MHPIVRDFVTSNNRFRDILPKYIDRQVPLEKIWCHLAEKPQVSQIVPKEYVSIDAAVTQGHSDKDVYLLFLSYMLNFMAIRGDFTRAKVFRSIIENIIDAGTHLVLVSFYKAGLSRYLHYTHDMAGFTKAVRESLSLVDKNCPRFISIIGNIAEVLALFGRLEEIEQKHMEYLVEEANRDKHFHFAVYETLLFNDFAVGNYQRGFEHYEQYRKNYFYRDTQILQMALESLKMLSGDFNAEHYSDPLTKRQVESYSLLLNGHLTDAKRNFIPMQEFDSITPFWKFFPLHIELSQGNKNTAHLLLNELADDPSVNYMIHFFWTRFYLLNNDFVKAQSIFEILLTDIKKYGAESRLLFEMQFAKEFSSKNLYQLLFHKVPKSENINRFDSFKSESNFIVEPQGVQLLIGESISIEDAKRLILKFSKIREPVLIVGETGTGKELVARAIHEEGDFADKPFLAINCSSLTESLLESELFGYEAGAFTGALKAKKGIFEAAEHGSVFLDEFGDIGAKLQATLLRVLESGEIRRIGSNIPYKVACRIIVATNVDLAEAVEQRKFRKDLFFRLKRFDIFLSPLRERREDIPLLIHHFLRGDTTKNWVPKKITLHLLQELSQYAWYGNVRELKNEIERMKILCADQEVLDVEDFDFTRLQGYERSVKKESLSPAEEYEDLEEDRIQVILRKENKICRRRAILEKIFQKHKRLTRLQVIEILNISPGTATKDLEALCSAGKIIKKTPSKSARSHHFEYKEN